MDVVSQLKPKELSTVDSQKDDLPEVVDEKVIADKFKLNEKAISELEKIELYTFNIFNIRDSTKQNELVVVISHIFAKEKIFDELPTIDRNKFIPFIKKIQGTYQNIKYHNQTHGADLA